MATWATAMADLAQGDPDSAETQLKTLLGGPADLDAPMGLGLVAESRGEGQDAVPATTSTCSTLTPRTCQRCSP